MDTKKIKIAVADDSKFLIDGLSAIISTLQNAAWQKRERVIQNY